MTDVTINTGTTVGISATLPATFDDAGYGVPVMTLVGEIIDVGELSKVWAMIAHQTVTRAFPQKLKDTYDVPDVSITIGKVTANGGQVLLQTALADSASYTFAVTLPSADIGYFTGKVTKAGIGSVASGAVSTTVVSIAIDPESLFET
tara:strand:+ start:1019 stop:1462 length:444 start_codon:yes stop_codon:yes gene_type:complete